MTRLLVASFDEIPSFKGASTHVLSVCRALRKQFDVKLLSLGEIALPEAPNWRHEPIALNEPNLLRRGEQFRRHVAQLTAQWRPSLAHFRSPWEGLPLVRANVPTVYEVNGLASIELPQTYRVPSQVVSVLATWEAECLRSARAIVCPSARIARCLQERYGPLSAPISVIANGYDRPQPTTPTAAPPGADEPLRLVYLGTLHPWQGLYVVLAALAMLRGDGEGPPRFLLDIIGPPHRDFSAPLQRALIRRGLSHMVRLLPPMHRGRLAERLPSYHAGLLPLTKSPRNVEQGCCPIKALDYLAHGLPVIASDLFVTRQLLIDGDNALLVPANDAHALAQALRRLRDEPELHDGLRSRARGSLAGHPDWEQHGAQITALHRAHESSCSSAAKVRLRSCSAEN